jgi:hypothetical protein
MARACAGHFFMAAAVKAFSKVDFNQVIAGAVAIQSRLSSSHNEI